MSTEVQKEIGLEIGHVLFIDIVGYSKLLIDEQRDYLHTLNEVVRRTDSFRAADAAGKLTRLPTGDGMALVFATTPDAPVSCALQVSKALRSHPELRVRIGIHSGPVSGITDVNDRSNVAGAGINLAQRVMDCAVRCVQHDSSPRSVNSPGKNLLRATAWSLYWWPGRWRSSGGLMRYLTIHKIT